MKISPTENYIIKSDWFLVDTPAALIGGFVLTTGVIMEELRKFISHQFTIKTGYSEMK